MSLLPKVFGDRKRVDLEVFPPGDFVAGLMQLSPSQCRAARGLLDWTQQELADAARIGVATVRLFEGNGAESRHATLAV
jgi:hypothetical protein